MHTPPNRRSVRPQLKNLSRMDYLGLVVESARQSLVNPIKNTKWSPRNGLNNGLALDQVGESVWNPRPNVYRYDLQDHYNAGNCLKKQSSPRDVQFAKNTSGNYLVFHVEEKAGHTQYWPVRKGSSANGYCIDGLDNAMFAVTAGHRDWRNMSVRDIRIARGVLTVTMENSMGKDSYAIIRINDDGVKLVEDVVTGKHGLLIDRLSDLIGSKYMIPIESTDDVGNPRETDVDESDDGNSAKVKDWSYLEDEGYDWREDGIAPIEGMIVALEDRINKYFHPLKYRIIPHVDRIEIIVKSVRKRGTWPVPMPSYQRCTEGVNAILAEGHALGWECVGPYPSKFGNPPGGEDYILRHLEDKYGAMESAFSQDDGEGPAIRFTLESQDPKKVHGRDATAEELQAAEPAVDLRNEMDWFGSI